MLDVYPAREQPVGELAGVSGLQVAQAAADRMGGRPVWWLPEAERPGEALAERLDRTRSSAASAVLVTIGAGDVFKLGEALVGGRRMSAPPPGVERDFPLARLTTVRTGGAADWFARPGERGGAGRAARWAEAEGLAVGVVGSGSNLLVADEGFRGLAIKLDGELAAIERDGERLALRRRRPAALGGGEGRRLGPLRPRVRDQHPRHRRRRGEDERQRLRRPARRGARVGRRLHRRRQPSAAPPTQLGFAYRSSNLRPGEVVARASFRLRPGDPAQIRATLAAMRERRREAQPSGIKTFGSTFKNPEDERAEGRTAGQLLEAAGCRGLRHGGARFSEKHANFVENAGEATTADVLELMAAGRRRVHERFGVVLEPEVQVLGEVRWPGGWEL